MMERIYEDVFQDRLEIKEDFKIVVSPRSKGESMVDVVEGGMLRFELDVMESSTLKLFIRNLAKAPLHIDMRGLIHANAHVEFSFLDLEEQEVTFDEHVRLFQEGASIDNTTSQLVRDGMKKGNIEIRHEAAYTSGHMHNFAVLFDHAKYEMVANGNIEKKAKESASHQETRVLTLGKDHAAKVIPLLLIDENEVKASHALTIGEPDEAQLYYLQSRGLSKEMALGLLSVGYFMPTIRKIEDETLREQVREDMERKVGVYGHQG